MTSRSPGLPIVDAHVHLWDPDRFPIPWLDGSAVLNHRYDVADFQAHVDGLGLEAFVFVQAEVDPAFALLETRWVVERARAEPRLRGIVAWAPVERGERLRSYLEALGEIGAGYLCGVRRNLQDERDSRFCLQPEFLSGLRLLPEYGLSFDICARHHQLPGVVEMVRSCPETQFMLDHLGKPPIHTATLDPWRWQVDELTALPNVSCKISGLVAEADHERWTIDDLAPYVRHALDAFGEDRVAFGSDWPVVLEASSYRLWVETLDRMTADLPLAARRKLWADNARRFYRIPQPAAEPAHT